MKTSLHTALHSLVLASALAACATPVAPQWEKSGANEAAVQKDSEQCGLRARQASQSMQAVLTPSPAASTDALPREEERAMHASQSFQECMREKGYSAKR
jgi:hypothetical protein